MHVAGMILVGGKSKRMGAPKATLPFGPELLIHRVLRLLLQTTPSVVVVAAPAQPLPALPDAVPVVRDRCEGRGPLEAIRVGLEALEDRCEAAYVTACDVPSLQPGFIRMLTEHLPGYRVAVPVEGRHYHPLAALYRVDVLAEVRSLLKRDRLRPAELFQIVPTCRVPVDRFREVDPDLNSLENLNQPSDYFAALARCGFDVDQHVRSALRNRASTPW